MTLGGRVALSFRRKKSDFSLVFKFLFLHFFWGGDVCVTTLQKINKKED